MEKNSVLACEISDSTGDLTALFYGRSHIPGIVCGSRVRFRGSVGIRASGPIMINPAYELLAAGESPPNGGTPAESHGHTCVRRTAPGMACARTELRAQAPRSVGGPGLS